MLWGSQAWVAVRAMPQLNFLEITLLLHAFALAGITTLNLFRLRDFVRDLKFLLRVRHALGFWILSGACQGVCFLLFYLAVQNGPQVPGMIMHFMWPFIFAIANALFPSTWKQHSSGYELKVVAIGLFGVWFLMQSGLAVGEHSALGLGKAALMLAALASAIFGGANAVFDDHALARSRARHVELLQAPELPVTFRYSALQIRFLSGLVAMLLLCLGLHATPLLLPPLYFGDISVQDLIAPFWLGFVVYFGADFFFDYTMTHLSEIGTAGLHLFASVVWSPLPLPRRSAHRPADGIWRADHPPGHVSNAGGHQGLDGQYGGTFPLHLREHHRASGARHAAASRRT